MFSSQEKFCAWVQRVRDVEIVITTKKIQRFLSRVSIMTRDIDIANLSVSPSVRLSVTFRHQIKTA